MGSARHFAKRPNWAVLREYTKSVRSERKETSHVNSQPRARSHASRCAQKGKPRVNIKHANFTTCRTALHEHRKSESLFSTVLHFLCLDVMGHGTTFNRFFLFGLCVGCFGGVFCILYVGKEGKERATKPHFCEL